MSNYTSDLIYLRLKDGREYPSNVKSEIRQLVETGGAEVLRPRQWIAYFKPSAPYQPKTGARCSCRPGVTTARPVKARASASTSPPSGRGNSIYDKILVDESQRNR